MNFEKTIIHRVNTPENGENYTHSCMIMYIFIYFYPDPPLDGCTHLKNMVDNSLPLNVFLI